jgi:hypothetical protein
MELRERDKRTLACLHHDGVSSTPEAKARLETLIKSFEMRRLEAFKSMKTTGRKRRPLSRRIVAAPGGCRFSPLEQGSLFELNEV